MSALQRLRSRITQVMPDKKPDDACEENLQEDTTGGHTETNHSIDITDHGTWMRQIMASGNKVEDWLEFTNHMKEKLDYKSNETYASYITSLYARAVKTISPEMNKDNPAYALVLVNFAKFKSSSSVEDARGVLHYARNSVKRVAIVHIAAAELEASQGNRTKANRILEKARQLKAQPEQLLSKAFDNLSCGKPQLLTEEEYKLYMNSCLGKENILPPKTVVGAGKVPQSPLRECSDASRQEVAPPARPFWTLQTARQTRHRPMSESSEDNTEDDQFKKPLHLAHSPMSHPPCNDPVTFKCALQQSTMFDKAKDENTGSDKVTIDKKPMRVSGNMSEDSNTAPISLYREQGIYKRSMKSFNSTPDVKASGSINLTRKPNSTEDSNTNPETLDKDRGISGRSLRAYHSTPDFKTPAIFSANRKPRNLGKPMRVKRTSLPELREGATDTGDDPNSDFFRLDPLPDTEDFSANKKLDVIKEVSSPEGPVLDPVLPRSNRPVEKGAEPKAIDSGSVDMDFKQMEQWLQEQKKSHQCDAAPSIHNTRTGAGQFQNLNSVHDNGAERNHRQAESCRMEESMEQGSPVKPCNYNHLAERFETDTKKDVPNHSGGDSEHSKDSGFSTQPIDPTPASNMVAPMDKPVLDQSMCTITGSTIVSAGHDTGTTITAPTAQPLATPQSKTLPPAANCAASRAISMESNSARKQMFLQQGPGQVNMVQSNVAQPSNMVQHGMAQPNMVQANMSQPGFSYIPTPSRQTQILTINSQVYTVLQVMGRGGSSKVYETLDPNLKLRAVKCVDLDNADLSTINSYKNEIKLLERLQHSDKIIRMYDYEYDEPSNMLYVVMERGDTDLASHFKVKAKTGGIDSVMQKFYWKEMLKAVQILHTEGIVHSDLKPANFVLVAGNLKLIDFGIANVIQQDMTSVTRDNQIGTINYMSPEAIQDTCGGMQIDENGRVKPRIKIGVKSDVWSLGCILYNLVYGRPPFHKIANNILRLQAITNPKYLIDFPDSVDPTLRDVLMKCLRRIPKERPCIEELLAVQY